MWEKTWHELRTTLLGGCMQCKPWSDETKCSNRLSGSSDIRNPWFPSEYPTTSTSLLCWVNKVPGFEVMFQRACLIPTAGWNSRSIQLNHILFGLHTPMRRCNILGQSGSLIFQLSIWSIEMFSPKQKTCVNNGIYGVSWSELIGMVQKTVHASQALATKGPIVLFKAIWWNIIFHNIRS